MEVIPRNSRKVFIRQLFQPAGNSTFTRKRTFCMAADALPNRDAVAIISDRRWQAQFKRDPAVLGREIYINGTRFKLIGIAPPRKFDSRLGWKLQGNDIRR